MSDEHLISMSGAPVTIDFEFLAQLGLFNLAFERNPNDAVNVQRALAYLEQRNRQDLMPIWAQRAFAINPTHELSLFALASSYELIGRFDLALPQWHTLARLYAATDPLRLQIATALVGNGMLEEAHTLTSNALAQLARNPQLGAKFWDHAQYTLRFQMVHADILLRRGDAGGFNHFLAQLALRVPSFHVPRLATWNGENIAGKHLLMTSLGGYGDQLLFASAIPNVLKAGAKVSLAVNPDLEPLFRCALPQCDIFTSAMPSALRGEPSAEIRSFLERTPADFQATSFHLPLLAVKYAPKSEVVFPAYLKVPDTARQSCRDAIAHLQIVAAKRKIIGVTWDRGQRYFPDIVGGTEACRTARTSMPLEPLLKIITDETVAKKWHFLALHESQATRAWPQPMPANMSAVTIAPGDFSTTSAVIDACDLVLSVDMSVANLAAMLGKPTWLMLAHEGDWRWGDRDEKSPWIAGVKLFRQTSPGDWNSLAHALYVALTSHAELRSFSGV